MTEEPWSGLDVSRETIDRLRVFESLLNKWSPRINLVSRATLPQFWTRHAEDSIQVFRTTEQGGHWADLGSGGGFPGLVVAIVAAEERPDMRVTLVESDQRKSAFLRTVARETGVACNVIARRIEQIPPLEADILSARALADLGTLLGYAERHLGPSGVALFPKGATWEKEITAARREWKFDAEPITSKTEPEAVILRIKGVECG